MKRNIEVSVILPCFNEEQLFDESVRKIINILEAMMYRSEVIFVDDKSTDGTTQKIRTYISSFKKKKSRIEVKALYHEKNMGRGRAVTDGIKASTGTVVGYIDIDCEVSPVYIPEMAQVILQKQADVVIGRRQYRTTPGSIFREVLSRGYMWLSDKIINTGGMDTETGYKFFNKKKIAPILRKVHNMGWFWDTEIMALSKKAGLRITELPVLFMRRFDKTSSVHVLPDTLDYLKELWSFRKRL